MLTNHPRIRLRLYLASIGLSVVGVFVAVAFPEYGAAAAAASAILGSAAGITAATNLPDQP
jgi:drug/metabolite transporter (DMT)-like permease